MTHAIVGFTLDTLLRKKFETLRRKEKDVRLHNRLSAVLWLGQGRSPEEVAELAVFLASDRASYINGAVIAIDGAQTAQVP